MAKHDHRAHQRAITNEAALERKQRRIRIVISVLMLVVLLMSSIAYFFTPDPNSFSYNGHRFGIKTDANGRAIGYATRINGQEYLFYSRPGDTADVTLPPGFAEIIQNAQFSVLLFDPNDNITESYDQFRFDFAHTLTRPVGHAISAVPDPLSRTALQYAAFPQYNCSASTMQAPVILLTYGQRAITMNDTCFVVSGTAQDYPLLRDRVVYRLLNITES